MEEVEIDFKTVFENCLDAVIIAAEDGRIITANTAACEMFRMSVDELITTGRDHLVDMSIEESAIRRAERGLDGTLFRDFDMIRKGGNIFHAEVSSKIFTSLTGHRYNVIVIRDITRTAISTSLLREKEANLRSMIENTDGPVWSIDKNFRLIACNRKYLKRARIFFGIDINIGDNIVDCLPEKSRKLWEGSYIRGLSGESFTIQASTPPPLGPEEMRYHFNPITLENGEIVGLTMSGENITDLVTATDELKNTAENLRALTGHMEDVIENERTTLAHELHDDLGQKLTAIKMNLSWIKSRSGNIPPGVSDKFDQTMQLLEESLNSTRRISKGLRPVMLEDLGLVPTLKWQIGEFTKTSGIKCRYSFNPEEIQVNSDLALTIFRVIQETLTNVARHSEATEVTLDLATGDKVINIFMRDNGKGIDSGNMNINHSLGILGMKERIESHKGKIQLEGLPERGTTIKVSLPLV